MLAVGLRLDTAALDASCERLLADFERATEEALTFAAERVATQARTSHPYRNRTGDLESSTHAEGPSGSVWDDSLRTWVVASEEYASYVNARLPFLQPAYDAVASEVDAGVALILAAATR